MQDPHGCAGWRDATLAPARKIVGALTVHIEEAALALKEQTKNGETPRMHLKVNWTSNLVLTQALAATA
jgi:hypothetical protein